MKKKILSVALLFSTLYVSAGVFNSVPSVSLSDSSRVYDLDEVVVISQPKEQFRLRMQPVSSSMFSITEINSLGVRDLRDLSSYVPSLVMCVVSVHA